MRILNPTMALVLAFINGCGAASEAPIISNNPIDVAYTATLPQTPFFQAPGLEGNVKGFISASAPPSGVGVRFTVRFENLPKEGGPFPYHIHVNKALNGNCTATGPHLDPENRGEQPPCSGSRSSCQVGDLAGKYGKITSDPFVAEYIDEFTSLKEGDPSFFGNRAFVIHLANSTRLTCADFVMEGAGADDAVATATASSGSIPANATSAVSAVQSTAFTTATPVSSPFGTSGNSSTPTVVIAAAGLLLPGWLTWFMLVAMLGLAGL